MKYQIQLAYDDYKAAMRLHLTPRRRFKIMLFPLLCFFALGCLLAVRTFLRGEGGQGLYIVAGAAAYFILLFYVLLPYRWKKNYKQQKLLHLPFQHEFTADSLCTVAEYGNSTLPWKEFHKWREGKTLFLVYQSDNMFHMIPKRIFQNLADQEQLRGYLTDKIGKPVT